MPSMQLTRVDVVIGVDTHKEQHVAVALDGLGGRLGDLCIPANNDGYSHLLAFARSFVGDDGHLVAFGVEGTGSYGTGLARFLRRHDQNVREVGRPPRAYQRRLAGKSDAIDAEHAARQVLTDSGAGSATPKTADGRVESLRLIKIARDTAVKARSAAMITLKAVLVTASDTLRADLETLSDGALIKVCAALPTAGRLVEPDAAMRHVLSSLAQRWLALDKEASIHGLHLKSQTTALAPELVQSMGIGPDTAAEMLIVAGDNSDRIRSEAAFAKMCGACPIPAGSGHTNGRHRLYRGGNRQANAALYRIVIVRMRWHEPTRAYVARRTAEGLSKREIIRCLKRYIAREVFHLIPAPTTPTTTTRPDAPNNPAPLQRAA